MILRAIFSFFFLSKKYSANAETRFITLNNNEREKEKQNKNSLNEQKVRLIYH